jgi:hypothetical protein
MKLIDHLKLYRKPLLFILPLLYLIAGMHFRFLLGNISLRSSDPDFVYFISGLSISEGSFKVGHIDHPGTPLQLLIAMVFRIVYLFRNRDIPYVEDVFLHPDLYLSVVSIFIAVITAALLLYAGRKVYESTNSSFYAILVQSAPFLPVIWYDLIGRVTPEQMLPFPIILLTVLVIKVYFQDEQVNWKTIVQFALVSALGLSVKLTYILLLIIPVFIIQGWKKRGAFVGLSLLFFFVIAFPVTLQIHRFWRWIKDLFIYSGQYGGGEANIIDFASLRAAMTELYQYEKQFFFVLFCLLVVCTAYYVICRRKTDKRLVLLSLAVVITIVLQLLMVGKHYAHRYFIPVLMLSPLMVFSIAEMIKRIWPHKLTTIGINMGIVALLFWNVHNHRIWLPIKTHAMGSEIENRLQTWHFASLLEDESYKIITSQDYGCPFIEYTLTYSNVWPNRYKRAEYATILNRLYPYVYNYFTWDDTIKYWGDKFDAQTIMESGRPTYLYIERDDPELFYRTINKLHEESETEFFVNSELLFRNPATTEVIYRLMLQPPQELHQVP